MSDERSEKNAAARAFITAAGAIGLALVFLAWTLIDKSGRVAAPSTISSAPASTVLSSGDFPRDLQWRRRFGANPSQSAGTVVGAKLADFSRKRLEWVRAKSLREGKDVPGEVEAFFAALQKGNWQEIDARFSELAHRSGQYSGSTHSPELDPFWPALLEAYGAAEQVHLWPAEKLLEYGDAILGKLRPGMVYVGGSDSGRFIPTMLNETSEGEPHVVLTQNALADARYLEYARSLYGDRLALPSEEVSKNIFEEYVTGARQRLEHDERFPDEPRQLKPGEDVKMVSGNVSVSGQTAVMAINEKLLQWTLAKNPEASFAVEESFPFRSTYESATPLGPIMEVRAEKAFTPEQAAETLGYWRKFAEQTKQDPPSENSADLKTYSHMAVSQANLLASHRYTEQAEATYKLAREIFPRNTDAALSYAQFLSENGRAEEAQRLVSEFTRQNPDLGNNLEVQP